MMLQTELRNSIAEVQSSVKQIENRLILQSTEPELNPNPTTFFTN